MSEDVTTTEASSPAGAEIAASAQPSCGCGGLTAAPSVPGVSVGAAPSMADAPEGGPLVYALGNLSYDFGTEARRDSFKQLMPPVEIDGVIVPPNPYDARQMVAYLQDRPFEARSLIWTLNLELTPIYAIEPTGAFGATIYELLISMLAGEILPENDPENIQRVSIPGRLTGRTTRLFSGQHVPVVQMENPRGAYGWKHNALVEHAARAAATRTGAKADATAVAAILRRFLDRVYYDMRNLGVLSADRALNYAATNAFQAAIVFSDVLADGMELQNITTERSPYARADADAWDVKLKFFDPENTRRARKVFRFTIDVSDEMPVTLGDVRTWTTAD